MRIRSAAIVYIGVVGLMATAGAAALWSGTRARLNAVEDAQKIVEAVEPSMHFVEAFALERGSYNEILITAGPSAVPGNAVLAGRGAATDAVFDRALLLGRGLPDEVRDGFVAALADARVSVAEARREALAVDAPSVEVAGRVVAGFHRASDAVGRAIDIAEHAIPDEFQISGILEISNQSNRLREQAGARSTLLSRYAATRIKFDASDRVAATLLSGKIGVTVEMIDRLAAQRDAAPVAAAVARLHSTFIDLGEPMYERMYEAAREGAAPPLDFDSWRDWTVSTLTTTLSARDVPVRYAQQELSRRRAEAQGRFALAMLALGAVLLFVLVGGWMVESRIVRPVERLTEALGQVSASAEDGIGAPHLDALGDRYGERPDEIGALARALGGFRDKTAETARLYRRLDALLDNLPQGVCVYDADATLVACNRRYAELYGLDPDALRPGLSLEEVVTMRVDRGVVEDSDGSYVAAMLAITAGSVSSRRTVELSNGRIVAVHASAMPGGGWLSTHMDVTERARSEAKIAHMASHDALTDLPNRAALFDEIDQRLKRMARDGSLAVLCVDLDRFKAVNDTLGHGHGDDLLKQVSARLAGCVRPGDLVARLGGDEFAVLVHDTDGATAASVAQRIIDRVALPYDLGGHNAMVGASIGIAAAPRDGADGTALLKAADLAMYRAKADGRGRYRFFESEMDAKMQERRALELDMREAVSRGEFELHYQPIQDLASDRISSFEALIRWNHPTRGRVSPNDFIPLAEETGLIVDIGAWVLRQACVEAAAWPRPVRVAVNLSPHQFRGGKLLLDVQSALADSGLPAQRLQLEITERVMLDSDETTLQTLHALRNLGTKISMDDFGIGYSSLSYLQSFPFDKIKIDQIFVRNLAESADNRAIVKAVTGLAADMGMTTTAEGVETVEQLELLRAAGCTEIQGYLISRPVPAAEAAAMMEATERDRDAA